MPRIFILTMLVSSSLFASSQSKKIINDYQELLSALVSIKSETEQYASEVKSSWSADSFMINCKVKYTNLKAAVDGLIARFQTVIRKPTLISSAVQEGIDDNLKEIKAKSEAFKTSYIKGASAKAGTGGFNAPINPMAVLQSGANLYKQIKGLISGEREARANEFKQSCAMVSWLELK